MKKPSPLSALPNQDLSLKIKDGLRELRFSAREGARHLAKQLLTTGAQVPASAPPLTGVVKMALQAAEDLDRIAVHLVSSANDYRALKFRLLVVKPPGPQHALIWNEKGFARNFYWVFKHLLKLQDRKDVMVREEALHQAGSQVMGLLERPTAELEADASLKDREHTRALQLSDLALALLDCNPLHTPASTAVDKDAAPLEALLPSLCVAAAMAGDIASLYPRNSMQEETEQALQTALIAAQSIEEKIFMSLRAQRRRESLSREVEMLLRHL